MKDVIIIGAGPAGITAAIYARHASLSVILLEKLTCGGQMIGAASVENYPGYGSISGAELSIKMLEDVEKTGIKVTYDTALGIRQETDGFTVIGRSGEYSGRSVIIASGASRRKLGCPGETEFAGRGVSYCAVCDGGLYKNKKVVVVGGGNSAFEDALWLSGICSEVYLVHRRDEFRADAALINAVNEKANITQRLFCTVAEIKGDKRVRSVILENVRDGAMETVECDGVFVAIGLSPDNKAFSGLVELTNDGYIRAGEDCATSVEGVFVAGDTREKFFRQIITAAADGAAAARGAIEYIRHNT